MVNQSSEFNLNDFNKDFIEFNNLGVLFYDLDDMKQEFGKYLIIKYSDLGKELKEENSKELIEEFNFIYKDINEETNNDLEDHFTIYNIYERLYRFKNKLEDKQKWKLIKK